MHRELVQTPSCCTDCWSKGVLGLWSVVCGVRCGAWGVWRVARGVWFVVCGVAWRGVAWRG
eukprot:5426532-Alexandrium_andersonii.AAC.1